MNRFSLKVGAGFTGGFGDPNLHRKTGPVGCQTLIYSERLLTIEPKFSDVIRFGAVLEVSVVYVSY